MLVLLLFCLLLTGIAADDVFEALPTTPHGWTRIGEPARHAILTFKIAMAAQDASAFEELLYSVSDPQKTNHGQYVKREALRQLVKPSGQAIDAIIAWLMRKGVDKNAIVDDGEWIVFSTTTANAENLLDTRFHTYTHARAKREVIRTLSYSIPRSLHKFVDMIQPTTRFSQIRPQFSHVLESRVVGRGEIGLWTSDLDNLSCNITITPVCLRDLYRLPPDNGLGSQSAGFEAFNNFLEEVPRFQDLVMFESTYAQYASAESFSLTSIDNGPSDQSSPMDSLEANLDAQYLISMAYPVPITAYSTSGLAPVIPDLDQPDVSIAQNEPYLDFLSYILAQPDDKLPHTLSTSYGEDEQSVPLSYRLKVCQLFGQLGARGVSVIFSSGDSGVGSACQTNDGKNATRFQPIFPATCPYVTSVGGTHHIDPEQATSFSSGGFSDTWPQPEYQRAAVEEYLSNLRDQWRGLYNASGRGFPDVAAQSSNFMIIDKGLTVLVGGTSASAPTFAGLISILNGLRIQAGKSGLGFLNPWIYSTAYKALNDITTGGSVGCTGTDIYSGLETPFVPNASWNATQGWDPVTGYGTPDFEKLKLLALAL